MGTWGSGIYSNDIACDVRDTCNEVYPLLGAEKGMQAVFEEYGEIVNSDLIDNDYASFWYALADWQWKHGILSDEIRDKTVALLRAYTGIDEWEESGSASDVRKRRQVLDKLRTQLESPQPPVKLPQVRLKKPKHKVGEVIIFKTCSRPQNEDEAPWSISCCAPAYYFRSEKAASAPEELDPPYDASDKYMAILCVGSEKEEKSKYAPDLYDEHSVYAFYDYVSDSKPDLDRLQTCGFLPIVLLDFKDFNRHITNYLGWTYTFVLCCQYFGMREGAKQQVVQAFNAVSEADRFHTLLQKKNYLKETIWEFELYHAFNRFFEEKVRLETVGVRVDNLLDENVTNPELVSPKELDEAHARWCKT